MRLVILFLVLSVSSFAYADNINRWYAGKYRATQNYVCSDQITNRTTYDLLLNADGTFTSEGVGSYNSPTALLTNYTFVCYGTWNAGRSQVVTNETFCTVNEVNQYNIDGTVVPAISRGFPYQSNFLDPAYLQFPAYARKNSFNVYSSSDFRQELIFSVGTINRSCNGDGQGVRLSRHDKSEIPQPVPVSAETF